MPDHSEVQARRDNKKKKHRTMEARMKYLYGPCTKGITLKDNPMFRDGMNYEKRKMTDIFCLVFFAGTMAAIVGIAIYALTLGNINKVIGGMDGAGNLCGVADQGKDNKTDFTDYPHVYISNLQQNLTDNIFESAVCVKYCPAGSTAPKCMTNSLFAKGGSCFNYKALKGGSEYTSMYVSYDVLGYCIPTKQCQASAKVAGTIASNGDVVQQKGGCLDVASQAGFQKVKKALFHEGAGKFMNDIKKSMTTLIATFITGFLYSTILLYFLSMFAETIAWFCVFATQLGLVAGCLLAILRRSEALALIKTSGMGDAANAMGTNNHVNAADMGRYGIHMIFVAVFMGIFAIMFFCMMFSQFKHIKTAINVIEASAEFLIGNPRVIVLPFIYFAVTVIGLVFWAYTLAAIMSLNDVVSDQGIVKVNFKPQVKKMDWNVMTTTMMTVMCIGSFWFFLWIQYSAKFVVMCSTATYYFNSDVDDEGRAEVFLAFKMTHVNHAGTVAFGSFAITLISIITFSFTFWAKKAVLLSKQNAALNAIVCCSECGLKCVETITDYLTLNAFSYIAITGDGFCEGAWKGFLMQIKHMLEFQHSMIVTLTFVSMMKFLIVVVNLITGWFIMYDITGSTYTTTTHWIPNACVALFSYLIASLFMSIFSTVARTLMMCMAVDMDLNNGKPEFGPISFHAAMHTVKTHNKKSGGYVQKKGEDVEEDLISKRTSSVAESAAPDITPIDNEDHENLF